VAFSDAIKVYLVFRTEKKKKRKVRAFSFKKEYIKKHPDEMNEITRTELDFGKKRCSCFAHLLFCTMKKRLSSHLCFCFSFTLCLRRRVSSLFLLSLCWLFFFFFFFSFFFFFFPFKIAPKMKPKNLPPRFLFDF
jgi:hypothetical protein